jgi:3-methyladenine DNA glycosylase AlkD
MDSDLISECRALFEGAQDPERALGMAHYMRDKFAYFGVSTPVRRQLVRPLLLQASRQLDPEGLTQVARGCWAAPEREMQYFACDLLARCRRRWTAETLELCQELACAKSWWDTVDYLASRVVGPLVERFPELQQDMDHWAADQNFWLRRVAILHQLHYRDKTDEQRLFKYCLFSSGQSEFFVRKAIGWALREYAKSAPERVLEFLEENRERFSPLSMREAMKHLGVRRLALV